MSILITGSTGMVGQNLIPKLREYCQEELLTPTRNELNLSEIDNVKNYLKIHKPYLIIHLAAKVGGIQANINEPVEFLVENTRMNLNLIESAWQLEVPNLINLGSSCMYPKNREILNEADLLTGSLEETNEGYAIAKLMSLRLCEYIERQYGLKYKTLVPCNLFGLNDCFDGMRSHLIPAAIRKIHTAVKEKQNSVQIWGDGTVRREFMFVDNLIDFILFAMNHLDDLDAYTNVGMGIDYTVLEYYQAISEIYQYKGGYQFELNKPVGMQRKLMSVEKANALGWHPTVSVKEGLKRTCEYYANKHV